MENEPKIEEIIHYEFKDKTLLNTALTHTSYTNETGMPSYERLEFLGDSILGCITAQNLFKMHPDYYEGDLSKLRAELVCEQSLASISRNLGLPQFLYLGVGEEKNNGRNKDSILSDSFEALLAAVYLDSDFDTAKNWLNQIMPPDHYEEMACRDWRTLLQEKFENERIEYRIVDLGPEVSERFTAQVFINGKRKSNGTGTTKRTAIQNASMLALKRKKRG